MNIVLIGMPTCGKSTVGVVVAKMLGLAFVDTDILIQNREGKKLKDIIDEKGNDGFEKVESAVIENISVDNTVIATGGSAVKTYETETSSYTNRLRNIWVRKNKDEEGQYVDSDGNHWQVDWCHSLIHKASLTW